jgi:hypothetical protein
MLPSVLRIRIRDPGLGAFLTPGSGIRNRFIPDPGSRIPDPGSQTHIFESLLTTFWVKKFHNSLKFGPNFFLEQFKNKILLNFGKFVATKKCLTKDFFFTPLFCTCFWIRDPRSGIRDKHPGSATLLPIKLFRSVFCLFRFNRNIETLCFGIEAK